MIEICDLSKIYPSRDGDVVALNHIDLRIEDGAIYGIIGLSGAGKSTLVRCINLLERPTSGKVMIDGEDITKAKKKRLLELRRSIGMIFQNFNLLEQHTAEGNILFPLEIAKTPRATAKERARELLELVGLSEFFKGGRRRESNPRRSREPFSGAFCLLSSIENGELDANYFQHTPYLNTFNADYGTDLVAVDKIHYEPFAVYGKNVTDFDENKTGRTILIPNDGSNLARALFVLRDKESL